jgi:ParB family chromosome partitioning protein
MLRALAARIPAKVQRTPDEAAEIEKVSAEYDALTQEWADVEDLPPDIEARLSEIDRLLQGYGEEYVYDPDDIARGGVFVVLGHDGTARIERGLIRPEDQVSRAAGTELGTDQPPAANGGPRPRAKTEMESGDEDDDGVTPLSERLVLSLTAHRTAALRDRVAENPDAALLVAIHAAVLRAFYPGEGASCASINLSSRDLARDGEGIEESQAQRKIAERHALWARQLPADGADLWPFITGLDYDSRLSLFAHAVSLSVDVVRSWQARPVALAHGEALAGYVGLDMATYWSPTAKGYFSCVTKARIIEAVREAKGEEAAARIAGLKKPQMAQAAETLVAGARWLPPLLSIAKVTEPSGVAGSTLSFAAE